MVGNIILCAMLVAMHAGKGIPDKSGIFVDGKVSLEIATAYVGGGVSDPNKGSSFRLSLQEKRENSDGMISHPRGVNNPQVYIAGFRYKGREYSKPGGFVDRIVIHHPFETVINLEQGKYQGSNPEVKSVTFEKFEIESERAEILIDIVMQSGQKIKIAYNGPVSYDGLY